MYTLISSLLPEFHGPFTISNTLLQEVFETIKDVTTLAALVEDL